jgi:hypothetical protein
MDNVLTWFLVVIIHGTNCPVKCDAMPGVTIKMPSQEICMQVKNDNSDLPLECWAKPK